MRRCLSHTTRLLAVATVRIALALLSPATTFAQSGEPPTPAVDLKPGTASYKVRLKAGEQVVLMDMTRTTESQNGTWLVTETTTTAGHSQTDETTVDKKTLILRKRVFREGSASAELQFFGHQVIGTISEGRKLQTVNADAGGVIFADGSGGEDVIATLPFAQGYTAEFLNFNIGSQQVKRLALRVAASETVTVPAGTFHTWKAVITSLDGGSDTYALWVEKRTHRLVKFAMSVPKPNDAVITAELTK